MSSVNRKLVSKIIDNLEALADKIRDIDVKNEKESNITNDAWECIDTAQGLLMSLFDDEDFEKLMKEIENDKREIV